MNKIGIEHVDGVDSKSKGIMTSANKAGTEFENADVADACLTVKRQLEMLRAENGLLKQAVDDLRREIGASTLSSPAVCWSTGKYGENFERRSHDNRLIDAGDVNDELKKALKGTGGGGGI
uniref:Uncharacterized protein n=1 Tax=Rhizophora mucronata TaxID=61149 RepID=A0A2P2PAU5_RHIMU